MYVTKLAPIPNQQKSFYGKALLIQEGEFTFLKSYNTIVAQYDAGTKKLTVNDFYSNTTTRHIKAFVYLITEEILTTKEIKNKYYKN